MISKYTLLKANLVLLGFNLTKNNKVTEYYKRNNEGHTIVYLYTSYATVYHKSISNEVYRSALKYSKVIPIVNEIITILKNNGS